MKVGDLHFLLYKTKNDKTGLCKLEDFYTCECNLVVLKDGEYIGTSQYDVCDLDTLLKSDNLYLQNVFQDYKRFGYKEHIVTNANNMMLKLISLYDKTENAESLNVAYELASWLMNAPEEYLEKEIKLLNVIQIEKRKHLLTADQQTILYDLIENPNTHTRYKAVAYGLLGDKQSFDHYFTLLSEEDKKYLTEYPISVVLQINKKEQV